MGAFFEPFVLKWLSDTDALTAKWAAEVSRRLCVCEGEILDLDPGIHCLLPHPLLGHQGRQRESCVFLRFGQSLLDLSTHAYILVRAGRSLDEQFLDR